MSATAAEALTRAIIDGDDLGLHSLLQQGGGLYAVAEEEGDPTTTDHVWPLLAAVKCRKPDLVARLVERHGMRSRRDARGRSELHALAESQRGPFPPLPEGFTAKSTSTSSRLAAKWHESVRELFQRRQPAEVVTWQVLMRAGALPFQGDEFGATPFHIACSRGNWPVVHHLLELGRRAGLDDGDGRYSLNQRDQNGETALHWAARSGRRDIVALLLAQPAIDAAVEGTNGTAAQVAREGGHESIARMIDVRVFSVSPLLEMPWDTLLHVLSFLEPFDLCSLAQVCSSMAEVSSDDALWRRFCPEGNDHHTVRSSTPPDNSGSAAGNNDDGTKKQRHAWKSRYMEWLRPNLHQFAHSQQGSPMPTPPNRLKVVLVGDEGVGKSTLLALGTEGKLLSSYRPTMGVEFKIFTVPGHNNPLLLQLWDTAGQARFHNLARSYLRGTDAYVMVYNVENAQSLADLERVWLPKIRQHSDVHIPIFLVGIENVPARRRGRAVHEADAQAAAREIGAFAWTEISLGSEGAVAEAESVFARLASAALARYLDPFSQLWAAATKSSFAHGRQQRSWHVPSTDLCSRLLAQSKALTTQHTGLAATTHSSCVLQ